MDKDTDLLILEESAAIVSIIDRRYRKANFNDKIKLKKDRDKAFNSYAKIRLKLLEEGRITKKKDVTAMKEIRLEVSRARKCQTVLAGVAKFISFCAQIIV